MITRRFGRTQLSMPIFSTGGMRYQLNWKDVRPEKLDESNQANLKACILKSLSLGLRHIETARGYGTSEYQLGLVLKDIPRESYILQTKVAPTADPAEFMANLKLSFELLQTDRLDLFAFHGVNLPEHLHWITRRGGCLDAIEALRKNGKIRHIGFSTHGLCRDILKAIQTDIFDYVNLHWYAIDRSNEACLDAATERDMGVFIISPNDKGGRLYDPPRKLRKLTAPLSPMVFNDLFCLTDPRVHTISLGVKNPSDFDEHLKVLPYFVDHVAREMVIPVVERFEAGLREACGAGVLESLRNLPSYDAVPHQVNLQVILRLWALNQAYNMKEYGKMRYNLLGNAGHWFPGFPFQKEWGPEIKTFLSAFPEGNLLYDATVKASKWFKGNVQKRLSQSD